MSTQLTPLFADIRSEAFPVLTAEQINRLRPLSKVRDVKAGDILFEPGDSDIPFFVLLSGSMEIVQPDLHGERLIVKHEAGQFSGEMTMISGRRALARGRVTSSGEFLEMTSENLRALVARDAGLSEIFMRAFILRRVTLINRGQGNVVLMGSRHSAQTLRLREFLTRNAHPHTYVDLDTDTGAQELLDRFHITIEEIPVVICNNHTVLRSPSIQELTRCLGLNSPITQSDLRDLVIVGAGPAGLGAAVYAASEGLDVLVFEADSPGGQAGSSSKIENYLGFPMGISGNELAGRAAAQAQKFGAKMLIADRVTRLNCDRRPYELTVDSGQVIRTRTVVIASGAQYNKPKIENLTQFEGQGIYYGATYIEAQLCGKDDVIVVGGGNSAGQAAVYLSQTTGKVHMLVRSAQLSDTMSRYLTQRIEENPAIEVHYCTEIVGLAGGTQLEQVTWQNKNTGETSTHNIRHVFIMAGASPHTDWLKGCVLLDSRGFILTGRDLDPLSRSFNWPLPRAPQMLETSLPGVFAVGDVRAGNVKRVASAVGEGSISISLVHRALAEL
ncbi:MAG TPA: FAD-dependent oxidoreductase [Candidatus Acidoferrales bacterium]|jgi:thioredoxin reductase (NADPH)|nr:FAD-dependent oxidoreductase [Candidatus Acidoferrales bacterium]